MFYRIMLYNILRSANNMSVVILTPYYSHLIIKLLCKYLMKVGAVLSPSYCTHHDKLLAL